VTRQGGEATGYWFMNVGEDAGGGRSWDDCRRYGFLSAGGTEQYQQYARTLRVRDKVFAYLSGHGYVGLGEVVAEAVPYREFVPDGEQRPSASAAGHDSVFARRLDRIDNKDANWTFTRFQSEP
jgi:hypothetical protein